MPEPGATLPALVLWSALMRIPPCHEKAQTTVGGCNEEYGS